MIARPQGRQSNFKKVKVIDGDSAGPINFTAKFNTRVRAPEPAYRGSSESFKMIVSAAGRAKTTAGPR